MTFKDKLESNRRAYISAKNENRYLNSEVAMRNNIKNIHVAIYRTSEVQGIVRNNGCNNAKSKA